MTRRHIPLGGDVELEAFIDEEVANSGSSSVLTATKHVTSAEILALFDTPFDVVAAPGSDKMIYPQGGYLLTNPGAVAYTFPDYGGNSPIISIEIPAPGFGVGLTAAQSAIESLTAQLISIQPNTSSESIPAAATLNQPAQIYASHGNLADGDGSWDIVYFYSIVDFT